MERSDDHWPELPLSAWEDTYHTLHLWTQIVGKIRLGLAPLQNHWWNTALYVNTRGLTTSPIFCNGTRAFELEFNFIDHRLELRTSDGQEQALAACAKIGSCVLSRDVFNVAKRRAGRTNQSQGAGTAEPGSPGPG